MQKRNKRLEKKKKKIHKGPLSPSPLCLTTRIKGTLPVPSSTPWEQRLSLYSAPQTPHTAYICNYQAFRASLCPHRHIGDTQRRCKTASQHDVSEAGAEMPRSVLAASSACGGFGNLSLTCLSFAQRLLQAVRSHIVGVMPAVRVLARHVLT